MQIEKSPVLQNIFCLLGLPSYAFKMAKSENRQWMRPQVDANSSGCRGFRNCAIFFQEVNGN